MWNNGWVEVAEKDVAAAVVPQNGADEEDTKAVTRITSDISNFSEILQRIFRPPSNFSGWINTCTSHSSLLLHVAAAMLLRIPVFLHLGNYLEPVYYI